MPSGMIRAVLCVHHEAMLTVMCLTFWSQQELDKLL